MNPRQRLIERLNCGWRAFQESYAGLTEAELLEPNVIGSWCVKDIIAHVTSWEEEALKHLPAIMAGQRPPRYSVTHGGIDAFNAVTMERRKRFSLEDVLKQQRSVHARLLGLIEGAADEHLQAGARFRRRLRLDTYGHYAKHAAAIRKWRTQRR